jgi:hypothetical protein
MSTQKIGMLTASEGGPWVTFKDAKSQIRKAAKDAGLQLGAFRPRRENKGVLQVQVANSTTVVTASRRVNAPIEVIPLVNLAEDPDILAAVEAELGTTF